jgi:hypothetical protein
MEERGKTAVGRSDRFFGPLLPKEGAIFSGTTGPEIGFVDIV